MKFEDYIRLVLAISLGPLIMTMDVEALTTRMVKRIGSALDPKQQALVCKQWVEFEQQFGSGSMTSLMQTMQKAMVEEIRAVSMEAPEVAQA